MKQLFLKRLEMIQFKNHSTTKIDLLGKLVCIIGDNGMGKTNILDAIYTLAMSKSYISYKQSDIIQDNQEFVRLVGDFTKGDTSTNIVLKYPKRGKKQLVKDGKAYDLLKEHIGHIPVVIITPDDVQLLLGGSVDRRSFIDNTICQIDPSYMDALSKYNHVLKQKSALLKSDNVNHDVLDIYDQHLIEHAAVIHSSRKAFFKSFVLVVTQHYHVIAEERESVGAEYKSQLNETPLAELLRMNRGKEVIVQRCLYGIHKDDMVLTLTDHPVKSFASQGQRKSLLLSLKIAQFDYIRGALNVAPIILLDDLFDKLDQHRVQQLMKILTEGDFGQIFITDTSRSRVEEAMAHIDLPTDWLMIKDGTVINLDRQ